MNSNKKIYIIAMGAHGTGLSGGDRICVEFARRWAQKNQVIIYIEKEGYDMYQRQHLSAPHLSFVTTNLTFWNNFGFFINYLSRIISGIKIGLTLRLENTADTIIYSASEFWMDSLTAYILKRRFPQITWAATWYQTAPNPLKGFAEGKRSGKYRVRALLYWLAQLPIKPLVAASADYALVNNEDEKKQYPRLNREKRVVVVIGAVHVTEIEAFKKDHKHIKKIYDAIFQGRFHAQKGVVELIEIWKKVTEKKPDAKLVMIGDGPLMPEVKAKIAEEKLEKNIILLGYVFDGVEKYTTFAQSKMVVHPAFYDSGGMAAAEAMAFGIPCVGFDLVSYKSYYPQGMMKVSIGDIDAFAKAVTLLLTDKKLAEKIGKEAVEMIHKNWSWDTRAQDILTSISA